MDDALFETVKKIAVSLALLDERGHLVKIDSLSIVDLVEALENETKIAIPPAGLVPDNFASLESITAFLEKLRK